MLTNAYTEFLFDTFVKFRAWQGWKDIYEAHDEEDREYFWMLEQEVEKGRLNLVKP